MSSSVRPPMNEPPKRWKNRLQQIPILGLALRAIEKGNQDDAKDMAASIAYFSFFSLFPLLVGVVAGASLFLDRVDIQSHLGRILSGDFPGSADFLRTNIETLVAQRGAASIASVLGLLWSASKVFGALNRGINLAFGVPEEHPFYLSKLRYFAMTVGLSLLLLVAVGASTVLDLVSQLDLTRFGFDGTLFASLGGRVRGRGAVTCAALLRQRGDGGDGGRRQMDGGGGAAVSPRLAAPRRDWGGSRGAGGVPRSSHLTSRYR